MLHFRPRFLREAVLVPYKDGYLVDGTPHLLRLRGSAAQRFLPALIMLMDGSRDLEQLQIALPQVPAEHIHSSVSMLRKAGLIENLVCISKVEMYSPQQREACGFLRRFLPATEENRSAEQVSERLQASEVLLVGKPQQIRHLELLQSLLLDSGVPNVRVAGIQGFTTQMSLPCNSLTEPTVVALSLGGEDCDWYRECDDYFCHYQRGWLRCVVDVQSNYADIGPHFRRKRSPCYDCFQHVHLLSTRASKQSVAEPRETTIALWASMIAVEIIYCITCMGQLLTYRGFRRYDLNTWESTALSLPYVSDCSRCWSLDALADREKRYRMTHTASVFEDSLGLPCRPPVELAIRRDTEHLNVTLCGEDKEFPSCPQVSLIDECVELKANTLDLLSGSAATVARDVTLEKLATILRMSAGIRSLGGNGFALRRWAATSGNLGSVELYVVVRSVSGMRPGLYFYQPREHSLARLEWRSDTMEPAELVKRIAATDLLPDAIIICTGAFQRVQKVYGPFGYRLVNMDAGVAIAQLHVIARGVQLWSQTVTKWPDDLIQEQLHLDAPHEQVTGVVLLGCAKIQEMCHSKSSDLKSGRQCPVVKTRDYYGLTTSVVLDMLRDEVCSNEAAYSPDDGPLISSELLSDSGDGLPTHYLPRSAPSDRSIQTVLLERQSIRDYTRDPVSPAQIGAILGHGCTGNDYTWPDQSIRNHLLKFYLLALHVEGLPRGMYVYDPGRHTLCLSVTPLRPELMDELFVESKVASAPAHIWIVGDLALTSYRYGAWGYRQLLLSSGFVANRFWLAALSVGLSGCIVAGLVTGAARQYLNFDGRRRAAILSFTFGHGIQSLPMTLLK